MKIAIRVSALVLAMVMLLSTFVACGNGDEPGTTPGGNNSDSSNVGNGTEEVFFYKDLPQMDWEGAEYRILGRNYAENNFKNFEVDYDEMPEDVVGLAVWNRNAAIKAKYGLDVVGTLTDEKPHIPAKLALESGEDL